MTDVQKQGNRNRATLFFCINLLFDQSWVFLSSSSWSSFSFLIYFTQSSVLFLSDCSLYPLRCFCVSDVICPVSLSLKLWSTFNLQTKRSCSRNRDPFTFSVTSRVYSLSFFSVSSSSLVSSLVSSSTSFRKEKVASEKERQDCQEIGKRVEINDSSVNQSSSLSLRHIIRTFFSRFSRFLLLEVHSIHCLFSCVFFSLPFFPLPFFPSASGLKSVLESRFRFFPLSCDGRRILGTKKPGMLFYNKLSGHGLQIPSVEVKKFYICWIP